MKSLIRQHYARLLILWLLAAGTLFLLLHFYTEPLLVAFTRRYSVEKSWEKMNSLGIDLFLYPHDEDDEDEEALELYKEKTTFLISDENGEILCAGRNASLQAGSLSKVFQDPDSFQTAPSAALRDGAHSSIIELRGKILYDGRFYYVYIYKRLRSLQMRLKTAEIVFGCALLLSTLLFSLLYFLSGRSFQKNLNAIDRQSAALASGSPPVHFRTQSRSVQLSGITANLNQTADLIRGLEAHRKNLSYLLHQDLSASENMDMMREEHIADMTHQLKTPLAIISSQIELNQTETDEAKRDYYYQSILEEIDKMSSLISRILREEYPARSESQPTLCRICLSDLLSDLIPKYADWMEAKSIRFETEIAPSVYIMADSDLIEQAVSNYIINACSHTRPKKRIALSLCTEEKECILDVANDGNGIPEADIEKIWQRGYRSDKEKSPGSGLGLYIISQIVRTHNGTCEAANTATGVLFRMKFPLA